MDYDNPAGRLLEVLTKVRQFDKTVKAREVWVSVFSMPKHDSGPRLTAMLAKTMMLPHETVCMLEEDHPELISPLPNWTIQVSNAFQVHNVHGTIETFTSNISDDTLANVRTAAVLLNKGSKRKVLLANELTEMHTAIATVLTEVLASDQLDEGLQIYLARALRKIITAIEEYKLTGATPILESVEQAVGHAIVDPEYKSFLRDSELGKRVLDALQAASAVVTVAVGMPTLALAAQQLLK